MSDTFSQIHIQVVFAVKYRQSLISSVWEERLYQYITGTIQKSGQKLLAIGGVQDHIHFLIGMRPTCCLSDLVRDIKKSSTELINSNKLAKHHFQWQAGFGAFCYEKTSIDRIVNYIWNQKEHHKNQSFKEEYRLLLRENEVEFKEEYLFDWISDHKITLSTIPPGV